MKSVEKYLGTALYEDKNGKVFRKIKNPVGLYWEMIALGLGADWIKNPKYVKSYGEEQIQKYYSDKL